MKLDHLSLSCVAGEGSSLLKLSFCWMIGGGGSLSFFSSASFTDPGGTPSLQPFLVSTTTKSAPKTQVFTGGS
jgi:hypothetical protein